MPPSSRMKPNPLSMRSLAIVPVGIPEALRWPSRKSRGTFSRPRATEEASGVEDGAGRDELPVSVELENRASLGVFSDGSQAKVNDPKKLVPSPPVWLFLGSAEDK